MNIRQIHFTILIFLPRPVTLIHMGLIWEMHQQGQGRRRDARQMMASASLEQRVAELEKEVDEMNNLLERVITKLEETLGTDLDGDGKVPVKK